ncbi:hypothetical protein DJ71_05385 [Halorubrum sp. E3]|nr:hypothetical protein DJ71_05385 [Halorubrum sp. E3]
MTDPLEAARMHLVQAVTRSAAGCVLTTLEHCAAARRRLESADREWTAAAVASIGEGDVCSSEARYHLRELAQLLVAWGAR